MLLTDTGSDFTAVESKAVARFSQAGGKLVTADRPDWLAAVQTAIGQPSVTVQGPPSVRTVLRDQPGRTVAHLLNLNVQRLSSFQDRVEAATNLVLTLRVPFKKVRLVQALTADADSTSGPLTFTTQSEGKETVVQVSVQRLEVSLMVIIER